MRALILAASANAASLSFWLLFASLAGHGALLYLRGDMTGSAARLGLAIALLALKRISAVEGRTS